MMTSNDLCRNHGRLRFTMRVFLLTIAPILLEAFVVNPIVQISRSTGGFDLASMTIATMPDTSLVIEEARTMKTLVVDKMPDRIPDNLHNKYYFLRHGQSTANVAGIISSSRSLAYSDKHGLTNLGYEQGKQSASQFLDVLESENAKAGDKVIFVSSPFARAKQTAQACLDGLEEEENKKRVEKLGLEISKDIVMEHLLMERYFGRLDGEAIYTYAYVWPLDKFNVTHTAFDVESVAAVCNRLRQVIERCEEEYKGCHIVWTSHADVLQIGQLYAANVENVGLFSSYRFKNGEIRPMKRTPDSLPEPYPLEAPDRGLKYVRTVALNKKFKSIADEKRQSTLQADLRENDRNQTEQSQ